MGDSDEESERRRGRDKFMKERPDYDRQRREFGNDRRQGNFGGQQRDFGRSQGGSQLGYNDVQRRPGGNDMSPPMKRQRRNEWGDDGGRDGGAGRPVASGPSMMTFKQFLATQDDTINDDEAVRKYQDYKLEYRRQMIHSFFVAHKDEEWFRLKYFPEDSAKRKAEQLDVAKRRMSVFMELLDKGWVDRARLDVDNLRNVVRMLDGVVVKLEDGTDEDLTTLEGMEPDYLEDMPPEEDRGQTREFDDEDKEKEDKTAEEESASANGGENKKKRKRAGSDEDGAISDSDSDSGVSEKSSSKKSGGGTKKEPSETGEWDDTQKKRMGSPQAEKKTTLLHRTSSLFLRNIAPTITKAEIEALCKKFPGYLRTSLAEPMAERMFYRRGWVTFRRDSNIKDIWWNMSNVRISCRHHSGVMKDCELGAIINRDLTRKHRTVNGTAAHKQVAKNDLRLITKLIQMYDAKAHLWVDDNTDDKKDDQPKPAESFSSKNPLLANITDYLIEETSAEEDELLGNDQPVGDDVNLQKIPFVRDENILKVLDRLIWYLRITHSVDYYNHGEYPNEDEMPNRCGLIHVRGPPPGPGVGHNEAGTNPETGKPCTMVPAYWVNEFIRSFENKVDPLLMAKEKITDEEASKLGKKDPEKEVEAFITANCIELAKEKWLCPLSGKKFKGPDFVRKHILNKHVEKVDEVRAEVAYFNNFVYDAKRPGLPEKPMPSIPSLVSGGDRSLPHSLDDRPPRSGGNYGGSNYGGGGGRNFPVERSIPDLFTETERFERPSGYGGGGGYQQYGGNMRNRGGGGGYRNRDQYYNNRQDGFGQPRGSYGRGPANGRHDPRSVITYTDLDAPDEDRF